MDAFAARKKFLILEEIVFIAGKKFSAAIIWRQTIVGNMLVKSTKKQKRKPTAKRSGILLDELRREDFNSMSREQLGRSLRKAVVPAKPEK
jgi:hypothetical protein